MATSETIKSLNIDSVRKILNEKKSISKTDIVKFTGLSFPTVSSIIEYLIKKNEVVEDGISDSLGGRCAKKYCLNPLYAVFLSIYLEGNKINWIVTNFCRNKIDFGSVNIEDKTLYEIENIIVLTKTRYHQLASLTIGIASNIRNGKVTSHTKYNDLKEININDYLMTKYNMPVILENDMNIVAKGYLERSGNENMNTIVSIYIGDNGIGSSLILNGKLWKGVTSFAGELHYLPINSENNSPEHFPICTESFECPKLNFNNHNIIEYYGKIIQSYIVLINPNLIVLYNNPYISNKLEELRLYCGSRIPYDVMPNIILSNEFISDYEYGLSKIAFDLIN